VIVMPDTVTLRPVEPGDEPFLRALYASTREEELAALGWSPAQMEAFLELQFRAREQQYRWQFADAGDDLVLVEGEPAGRLCVERREFLIRIVDIAIAPAFRGRGAGTALLAGVIAEASATGKVVELHVETSNPALRLYRRLGFVQTEAVVPYLRMQWRPPRAKTAAQPNDTS
jgi:ribosomal protein S18 acetylase RimI-like enzyme